MASSTSSSPPPTTTSSSTPLPYRRRVVVTGMVTPLGCGVETTWKRLIEGDCGVRALTANDLKMDGFDAETRSHVFDQLSSKVAAIVPTGTEPGCFDDNLWLHLKEHRSISRFIGYALSAADEALRDANWVPTKQEQKERTELEHAKECGAKIYAELCGYGMSGDAYQITQPHNDGRGAILAMASALKQSGLPPNRVGYVNAHATSTPLGDAVEATAIKSVFGEHAISGALAISSTKGAIGHLLGAAGAVEAIFSVLAIHQGIAPLTLNLSQPDPAFSESFMPLTASKQMSISPALSNSFGFGGTNTSLLFAKSP